MMKFPIQKKTLVLMAVLIPLGAVFAYVAVSSGPLAPIPVTLQAVKVESISPTLYGIGTVEARHTYKIGPTMAGRLSSLTVDVGEHVTAGQLLGEMDPVDLDERIEAQKAGVKSAIARVTEMEDRKSFAEAQVQRYEKLRKAQSVSEELVATKQYELLIAHSGLKVAQEDLVRLEAEGEALAVQRENMKLVSPVDGLVILRNADPGNTIMAGQSVIEIIDPKSIWVNVRFDQIRARGLAVNLLTKITLRSQAGEPRPGKIIRVEPLADAVTEEIMAKVAFDKIPEQLPPIGELVEVTVGLPELPATTVVSNASIKIVKGRLGVWLMTDGNLIFNAVELGPSDLDGLVQVKKGLNKGDKVITYSEKLLSATSRVLVVDSITGADQ
ncbi:MAG: efflux RND transporter periplasmic adaptor subunit [Planctomycetes bacterium]|nr:efflux RND transporter periplasmic adaptor subunit [Planctomycetota bacterium]